MVDIEYIRKKHFVEGWSIRKISRNLSVARQTVRKALQSSEIPKYNLTKEKPCPVMDPFKEIVKEWLERDKEQPKNKDIQHVVSSIDYAKSTILLVASQQ